MKRQTGAEQHREKPAQELVGDGESTATPSLVRLTDEQKLVFDCLKRAEVALTQRQIALQVSCPAPNVEQALTGLVAVNLVARLNTLVPSYACRYPGAHIHSE